MKEWKVGIPAMADGGVDGHTHPPGTLVFQAASRGGSLMPWHLDMKKCHQDILADLGDELDRTLDYYIQCKVLGSLERPRLVYGITDEAWTALHTQLGEAMHVCVQEAEKIRAEWAPRMVA